MNFTRYWNGRWVRETRFSQYAANGLGVSRSQLTGLSNSLRRREVVGRLRRERPKPPPRSTAKRHPRRDFDRRPDAGRPQSGTAGTSRSRPRGSTTSKRDRLAARPCAVSTTAPSRGLPTGRRSSTTAATASSPPSVNTTPRRSSSSPSTTTSSGVRQAKLGASCEVQVPAEQVQPSTRTKCWHYGRGVESQW